MGALIIDYDLVTRFFAHLRVHVDMNPGDANLLCLQGVNPIFDPPPGAVPKLELNDNAKDVYNDTIVVVCRGVGGEKKVCPMLGTVDPGNDQKHVNTPGGQAHLTFGQHMYVKGLHPAVGGRPALRAFKEINRVWRDPDKNFVPSVGDKVATGPFGVNVHAGGTRVIGSWSAGCVNVSGGWDGQPWKTFMGLMDIHFAKNSTVGVTVWKGNDLFRFAVEGTAMKPTLIFGTLNPWVETLQKALSAKGFFQGNADGDWQGKTEDSVRNFQRANGLGVDGVVGPATWAKLI